MIFSGITITILNPIAVCSVSKYMNNHNSVHSKKNIYLIVLAFLQEARKLHDANVVMHVVNIFHDTKC